MITTTVFCDAQQSTKTLLNSKRQTFIRVWNEKSEITITISEKKDGILKLKVSEKLN